MTTASTSRAPRVLFVDDDRDTCELVAEGLRGGGYTVDVAGNAEEAMELLAEREYGTLVADIQLGIGESGLDLAEHAAIYYPAVAVIIVTGHGTLDAAVAALRARADDFIAKPIGLDRLRAAIDAAAERQRVANHLERVEVAGSALDGEFIGSSRPVTRMHRFVSRIAQANTSTLVQGESGTGKELVARRLHAQSDRSAGPFVAVNCAAIPAGLLESELFGHVRGSFTGAVRDRKGLFREAHGGTLLLDEVGDLPLELQPKLLRALETRTVRPVGSSASHAFDARLITATHRDLRKLVDEGSFRLDLYYRINVMTINVPPLRDRGDDILELAAHFVQRFAQRQGKEVRGIAPEAAIHLQRYPWPGNVRELENAMEQAVAMTRVDCIAEGDLPERVRQRPSDASYKQGVPTLEQLEVQHIEAVLERTRGNKSQAARLLGIDRRTLHRKLNRLASSAT